VKSKQIQDILKINPIQEILSHLGISFPGQDLIKKYANEKPPIRSELFSMEQMEQFAKSLAKTHKLSISIKTEHLLKRLADNEDVLIEVHNLLTESVKADSRISPAGEWLLDNFYLIEEQIRTGKLHLPKGYSTALPQLSEGPSEGLPRVYDIALNIISHSDGRVDLRSLHSFISSYQTIAELELGELWAIPIMLRLASIENLRRLAAQIAINRINKNMADYWADEMTRTAEKDPKSLILVIADMARSGPPLESSFVSELVRRLQGKGATLTLPLTWIEQRLSENGVTSDELVQIENQKQATDQVSISNSIGSLRFLGTTDWREFVEAISTVEHSLRKDLASVYANMDFFTRDHYRHVVEKIAKQSPLSETEVANAAVQLSNAYTVTNGDEYRKSHVGYYLIGKGVSETEKLVKIKFSLNDHIQRILKKFPFVFYVTAIILITFFVAGLIVAKVHADGLRDWALITLLLLSVLCASQFAVTLVNWFSTLIVKPDLLPRMDFSKGVPANCKTMVVVPTILTNDDEINTLIESLEVRHLANKDENIHFALLTDLPDADEEILPSDAGLVALASKKIHELNKKYGRVKDDVFFLFHRPRKWNAREGVWMGYERKRGKLSELNALVKGKENAENFFSKIVGEENIYRKIKYVITLDTDTQLPREAAWKLIATMAHPLNAALFSNKKKRVVEGYAILQPRVAVSLPDDDGSRFAEMHGNEPGIDPYTRTTSDVYQDLFHEGSFIGKGIYEVDVFERALESRFPEDRILSHDLLEGCYARSALVSDVQFHEKYPTRYLADMKRRHRWIRGDWQVATWMLPFVPDSNKKIHRNPLTLLSRWKIFDNLRRSLVPPAMLLLLIMGWTILQSSWLWSLTITAIIILPSFITFIWEVTCKKPPEAEFRQHLAVSVRSVANQFAQNVFILICLPYEAYINCDAIIRTNWRMIFSKIKLLEWNPSSNVSRAGGNSLYRVYLSMWFGPFISFIILWYLIVHSAITLVVATPFLIAWILSPAVAWLISLPQKGQETKLSEQQDILLRRIARKTWAFFENFVTPEDNWLPPDNYQEQPVDRVAHRTSPTNIGFSLLSNFAASDFGYITNGQLIERTANTISTMKALEKYKGHFYNWYDTHTLQVLSPKYVSTVDSGNLAGHLIVLKQGLLSVPGQKIVNKNIFFGLRDTLRIISGQVKNDETIKQFEDDLDSASLVELVTIETYHLFLTQFVAYSLQIADNLKSKSNEDMNWWAQSLIKQCRSASDELVLFAPWVLLSDVPKKFILLPEISGIPTIYEVSQMHVNVLPQVQKHYSPENSKEENGWLDALVTHLNNASGRAKKRIEIAHQLAEQCNDLSDMEYDFLYDKSQNLLVIGYNPEEHRRDMSFYDLLASEARLGIFVAIAQGKIPQESWFSLGRQLTNTVGAPILLSWSGSMFEYLMPLLIMPTYRNTLLDQTYKSTVQKQIDYGKQHNVAWGISESGYNMFDTALNYQYRAFGVPGLGLKRGLGEDLVIAPYASAMALMVDAEDACKNLKKISDDGYEGKYGFYEAIDYSPSRLPRGQSEAVIKSFMAHHQGMVFLSLCYLLLDEPMQKRFEAEPQFQATLLLLQERIPLAVPSYTINTQATDISVTSSSPEMRIIATPNTPVPEVQLLSNGRYHVMISNAGGGYSKWNNMAITRWREDTTCDNWGNFCFIRDVDNNTYWSSAYQPALIQGKNYEVVFSQGRAEFKHRNNDIESHCEIVVSPEDDIEIRRIHLTNHSRKRRIIEITSYAEVVLASAIADSLHPVFSDLFVETEINKPRNAIICTRRPRSTEERPPWMFHLMKAHRAEIKNISYETDRMKFIGRCNSINNPVAIENAGELSNSEGAVLYPIAAMKYRILLDPQSPAIIDMVFGISETKEICNSLVEKYQDRALTDRVFGLSWAHSQVVLRQINATEADAQLYAKLASSVVYMNPALRSDPAILVKNYRGQSALWSYSISGDLPIVLLRIEDSANIELVKRMLEAHEYWRLKGLFVDLVIWNEDRGGYRQTLHNQILGLISRGTGTAERERPGGIFIRNAEQISNEDRILFQAVARIIITDSEGTLEEQVNKRGKTKPLMPHFTPAKLFASVTSSVQPRNDLVFFNGIGGFTKDGKEYVIATDNKRKSPLPWANVIANPGFGTVISENGQSYTWSENAHEFRLTPWNNDPVSDSGGEAYYIRDEESGQFWTPMPMQSKSKSPYITRHGFGYTVFEYNEDNIYSETKIYVDLEASVKFIVVKIRNQSDRLRKLSVTGYAEWVLGDLRAKSIMHLVTDVDTDSHAILANNPYNVEFPDRFAFFDADDLSITLTADRAEFIGRNGSLANPDAMMRSKLSNRTGAGLDSCAAIQVTVNLSSKQEQEVIFRIGAGRDKNDAINTLKRFRGSQAAHDSLQNVHSFWNNFFSALQIETPDDALNFLTNGWLGYQALACRLWARSGYYQSGGAFGFRDQLQDILSLLHATPLLARNQIILHASRQFREGDVQHWWHPPLGRGVRTRCSDDYLWLPYATVRYVEHTGDTNVLNEVIHFLEGRPLNNDEESYYDLPIRSDEVSTLYDHCVRSVKFCLRFGEHGLPLMGSGDWNDGMDKVGIHGKGESVWLAFFLYDVLSKFSSIAQKQNDHAFADKCRNEAEKLKRNIAQNAWDGEWYKRAYFDDGTPLGSHVNEECSIDSISQSWSVLSGASDSIHAGIAMESAYKNLVRKDIPLIQLLNPPFDKSNLNPGYIKGYLAGVRENGGQYTHSAVWMIMAFANLRDNNRVWELLSMINPINHSKNLNDAQKYKTEPYVMAADVYASPQHMGRGGWTWYTGSAGWMYQLIIESFLGLKRMGNMLTIDPCVPLEWKSFTVHYRFGETFYHIHVSHFDEGEPGTTVKIDGNMQMEKMISLADDKVGHTVEVMIRRNKYLQKVINK
jgi:cyclic beta-1,2-glucan synthetase